LQQVKTGGGGGKKKRKSWSKDVESALPRSSWKEQHRQPKQEIDMNQTSTAPGVTAIPEGFHTITPHLVCAGAAHALDFYARAFGAVEVSRLTGPDGRVMNAQLRIGDSMLMVCDEYPEHGGLGPRSLKGSPVTVHLYVADVDASFDRAVAAGATAEMAPAPMFWGDRYGQLQDPFGHRWSLATREREMTPEQIRKEADNMFAAMQSCEEAQQGAEQ
jgi:PhnB protein